MMLPVCRRLLAACVLLSLAVIPAVASQQGPPPRWWKTDAIVKDLGLTPDQTARIDKIFESTFPELRQDREELEQLEAKLSRMIQDDRTDEATIARQIDRVETARANGNKTRSLMLMRMHRVLTPDQRLRLQAITRRGDGRGSKPGSAPGNRPPSDSPRRPQF
jgi:Spy/CpxP family protein refolding chaperone